MTHRTDLPYRLGRAERRGSVFGWRLGQAAAAAVGVSALVLGVGAGGGLGVAVGVVVCGVSLVVAVIPVQGRGLDEWLPVAASHLVRVRGGSLAPSASVQPAAPDGTPAHLRWGDGSSTVLVELEHRGLRALTDEPRALGELLGSWLRGLGAAGAAPWVVSLVTTTGPGSPVHAARWAPAGIRCRAFVGVTDASVVALAPVLRNAGVAGVVDLSERDLDELVSSRVAPAAGTVLDCDLAARWRFLEGPATVHAGFVVDEWPSGDVDEQVLAAMCLSADRRTVCLTMSVEELHRARARTAKVRTAAAADEVMIEGGGFLSSPEAARDAVRDVERAGELAAGHGSVRLVGAISLDAFDALELEVAAARLIADATSCGVRLRRCDGDHRRGVLATVPGWCAP